MANDAFFAMDSDAARSAAAKWFVHCFPLVLTDLVRAHHPMGLHQFRLVADEAETLAPGLADNDSRIVLTSAWLDLTDGPLLLHLPHVRGRYFDLTLIDSTGQAFSSLGTPTGDDRGVGLALVGPSWNGDPPNGLRVKRSPGNHVWAVSRIRARSNLDYAETLGVAKRQRLASLRPVADQPRRLMSTLEPPCPSSLRQAAEITPALFFHRLDAILARTPESFRRTQGPRLNALRAELGGPPRADEWSAEFARALALGFADGLAAMQAQAVSASSRQRGWRPLPGGADNASAGALARAARAYASLGAPPHEDMLSLACDRDKQGRPLSGEHCYRIRFPGSALPPVQALWWLSAHPSPAFDQRRGIGASGEPNVNPDGSIDLILQLAAPDVGLAANWLPIPAGGFSLTMRLFAPSPRALSGAWRMPPVERLETPVMTGRNGASQDEAQLALPQPLSPSRLARRPAQPRQ